MYMKASIYEDKYLYVDAKNVSTCICCAESQEKDIYSYAFICMYMLLYISICLRKHIYVDSFHSLGRWTRQHLHIDTNIYIWLLSPVKKLLNFL